MNKTQGTTTIPEAATGLEGHPERQKPPPTSEQLVRRGSPGVAMQVIRDWHMPRTGKPTGRWWYQSTRNTTMAQA